VSRERVEVASAEGRALEERLRGESAGPPYDCLSALTSGCVEVGDVAPLVVRGKGTSATAPPGGAAEAGRETGTPEYADGS
jgi:hypothetical protein